MTAAIFGLPCATYLVMYASAEALDFLVLAENSSFLNRKPCTFTLIFDGQFGIQILQAFGPKNFGNLAFGI